MPVARKDFLIYKICQLINRGPVNGDVGVEVEVEGRNLPAINNPNWLSKHDGSLRGNAREYVFAQPLKFGDAFNNVEELSRELDGAVFGVDKNSPRTSVHVHLNVQKFFVQQIYTLVCLYLIFEDFLARYSGPDRVGNMYCLRYSDAEYLPLSLIHGLQRGEGLEVVANDNIRYSALNLKAIFDFGSVEFRTFRGSTDHKEINSWIKILKRLYEAAQKFNSPLDVVKVFDSLRRKEFCELIWDGLFEEYIYSVPEWQTLMHRGYLYSFEIAHALRAPNKWHPNLSTVAEQPPIEGFFKKPKKMRAVPDLGDLDFDAEFARAELVRRPLNGIIPPVFNFPGVGPVFNGPPGVPDVQEEGNGP